MEAEFEGDTDLTWGRYELLDELGFGGMGKVWQARDVTLDRVVAVKELAPRFAQDESFVARFLTEARAAARLNHPNIVQIYDFGQAREGYFLAMEFVDGTTLGALLKKRGLLEEAEAVGVVRQACSALHVAHDAGIVHRDVKPDNLMITREGTLKLVDLGLAKCIDEEESKTNTGMTMGSPYYMSPEQIRSAKAIDHRTDIYSLGATLYHVITGSIPYDGSSGPHIMSRHLTDPLPDPRRHRPELSDGICRIIRAMMAKDPDERYQDVKSVGRDLALLVRGDGPEPPNPSLSGVARTNDLPGMTAGPPAARVVLGEDLRRRIESEMMSVVGPVGKVLVRRAEPNSTSFEELCQKLAGEITDPGSRTEFLKHCNEYQAAAHAAPILPTGPTAIQVDEPTEDLGTPPPLVQPIDPVWTAGQLKVIETELMRRIGPLGRILTNRAAKNAKSLEDLAGVLSENIPDEAGRKEFARFVTSLS